MEEPDIIQQLSRAEGDVEDLPFTKYLITMATLLRDHLQTNVSDENIQRDMVQVVLFMQDLSRVSDTPDTVVHGVLGGLSVSVCVRCPVTCNHALGCQATQN
jgi:hypothetical protein